MSNKPYKINEKDIDSVIRYLKIIDPQNATREWAIAILEQLQEKFHIMSNDNPDALKNIYEDLKKRKRVVN